MTETVNVDGTKLRRFLTIAGDEVCDADEFDRLHADLSADLPPEPEPAHDPDVVAALTRARGQYAVDPASREILRRLAAEGHEVVPVGAVRDAVMEGERRIADLEAENHRIETNRAEAERLLTLSRTDFKNANARAEHLATEVRQLRDTVTTMGEECAEIHGSWLPSDRTDELYRALHAARGMLRFLQTQMPEPSGRAKVDKIVQLIDAAGTSWCRQWSTSNHTHLSGGGDAGDREAPGLGDPAFKHDAPEALDSPPPSPSCVNCHNLLGSIDQLSRRLDGMRDSHERQIIEIEQKRLDVLRANRANKSRWKNARRDFLAVRDERDEMREALRRLVVDVPVIRGRCDAPDSCVCSSAQALRLLGGGS